MNNVIYKTGRDIFENHIRVNSIRCLYHFTDKSNLPLIIKHGGLYSWGELENKNIKPNKVGGNELSRSLDMRKGLKDYVRLSFTKELPMRHVAQRDGRINDIIFIEIDPEVIFWQETLFSDKNATSNDARVGKGFNDFKLIDLDLIRSGSWANKQQKALFQAEVMVKRFVPQKYFLNYNDYHDNLDLGDLPF